MKLARFIVEEIINQGFNPHTPEGLLRIQWMELAWEYARTEATARPLPTLDDVITIGRLIEPGKNGNGFRRVNVGVGRYVAPSFTEVPVLMAAWVEQLPMLDPLEAYKRFEVVHPFEDGNGRSGKVILAWLTKTFDDPEFPPDFFGNGHP